MSKIRIKNFGPIKEGYLDEDGWMDIKKVTVFIGDQGSGKSTVAKLFSTLSWLEKAMVRGDFKDKELTGYKFVRHCAYQNIRNYFKDDTFIDYLGLAYEITYKDSQTTVKKNDENGYAFPKIMYVPAERNFVSGVKNINKLKGLPQTLYTFTEEDKNAKEDLKSVLLLPINSAKFEYRKPSGVSWIIGEDYEVSLTEASSGFQSSVPLFLVTRYLALSIGEEQDGSIKEISIEEEQRIKKEVEKILSNPNLSEEVKKSSLEHLSSRLKYSCFINIVEEPEQNLFPTSQRAMLNSLLKFNKNAGSKLIMTTHSPYIINYLTLAVKACQIKEKIASANLPESPDLLNELYEVVPEASLVGDNDWSIYELKDGRITRLKDYMGVPEDENYLNHFLADVNSEYGKLRKIEKKCL